MSLRTRLVLLATLVAVAAAVGTAYRVTGGASGPPALTTVAVTRGEVVETVEATGTLQAVTTVQVGSQVSGAIKALHADFNTRVRRGQVIAELDPSLFETQVEQARATVMRLEADAERTRVQMDDARVKLARARELSANDLIAASDLETAEVTLRQAEAAVRSAEAQIVQARASLHQNQVNLDHTIITSPIDGIVISRSVDVGQTVAASMQAPTLFVLARDLTRMQVNASVSEADIGRIEPGQQVSFRVDAYPARTFSGAVSQVRLEPVVQQNVVSYITVIDVGNADLALKPGMTASVTVEVARAADVLRVPASALRVRPSDETLAAYGGVPPSPAAGTGEEGPDNGRPAAGSGGARGRGPAVWVLSGRVLRRVPVTTGISDGVNVAVDGALESGALVVTAIAGPAAASASRSPLLPTRGGRGGGVGR